MSNAYQLKVYRDAATQRSPLSSDLVARREARGITRSEMARRLHVCPSTLRRWEAGAGDPPVHKLAEYESIVRRHEQRSSRSMADRIAAIVPRVDGEAS